MTDAQEKAYQTLWDEYGLVCHHHRLNLQEAFGREAPLVLEIGFGMGDSLLNQAINEPHRDFLGVEVHKPGVGRLMNEAKKAGVTNLRVICEDAVEVLADGLGLSRSRVSRFTSQIRGTKSVITNDESSNPTSSIYWHIASVWVAFVIWPPTGHLMPNGWFRSLVKVPRGTTPQRMVVSSRDQIVDPSPNSKREANVWVTLCSI